MKSDAWYPRWGSARGGQPSFDGTRLDGEVAPKPVIPASVNRRRSTDPIAAVRRLARHWPPVTQSAGIPLRMGSHRRGVRSRVAPRGRRWRACRRSATCLCANRIARMRLSTQSRNGNQAQAAGWFNPKCQAASRLFSATRRIFRRRSARTACSAL